MRSSSTTRKVLLWIYGILLLVSVGLIAWDHAGQRRVLERQAYAELGGMTGTLSAQLDGSRVTRLLERYDSRGMLMSSTQDAYYYVLHEVLRRSAEASDRGRPLQVVAFDPVKQELQVVITSEQAPHYREVYQAPAAGALTAFLRNGDGTEHRGVWGGQLAVFDPVRDARGRQVAAVVADLPYADLLADVRRRLWRNIGITVVGLLAVGLVLLRSVGRLVRREEDARQEWQRRHEGVADSMAYAGKIQDALIPRSERYREMFADHFVLHKPKDVVSGDFHWYHRLGPDVCLVAAADCTGHGMPGAMIAAIGCSLLNELVVQHPHSDPAELLGLLNQRMILALDQQGRRKGAGDGMDVALCRVDRKQHEVLFAGAFRPLYWMHDGQLTIINGDRKPVGGSHHDLHRHFSVHRIAYHPGDRLYLFSDGYVDQFGGPERKKFMAARFNEMLISHQHLPMAAQAEVLERAFMDWKGDQEQVDDVCVLGLAV